MRQQIRDLYRKAFVTDHPLMLLIGNLRRPSRFFKLAQYDQAFGLAADSFKIPFVSKTRKPLDASGPVDAEFMEKAFRGLKENGMAIFPGLFAKEAAEIRQRYMQDLDSYEQFDRYDSTFLNPTCNEFISSFILSETFLTLVGRYMGCQPYLRLGPVVRVIRPSHTTVPELGIPNGLDSVPWHIDTPTMVGFHLILNDVDDNDTHMKLAKKSHRKMYSESGIRPEDSIVGKYEIEECVGPAGTLYIFDHNSFHRPHFVENSIRATFEFYFTAGNQCFSIEQMRWAIDIDKERGKPDRQKLGEGMDGQVELGDKLSALQKEALRAMVEKTSWEESEKSRSRAKAVKLDG